MRYLSIITLFFISSNAIFSQTDWKLQKDKNGVKVYTRSVEGSKYKAFKANTTLDAPINEVYYTLLDSETYTEWYADCSESKDVEKISDHSFTRYTAVDVPWPFNDRDMVNKVVVSRKMETIRIDLNSAPKDHPEQDDIVRMPYTQGYWELTSADNKTIIEYSFLGDPGGLPAWIVNLLIVDGPLKSLISLDKYVKKSNYNKPVDL